MTEEKIKGPIPASGQEIPMPQIKKAKDMPALSEGPVTDFKSLEDAAKKRITKGDLTGLNPHKVARLCVEFRELKNKFELGAGLRQRCINSLSWMVADMKHRFDDCRNSFEVTAEGAGEAISAEVSAEMATGGYSAELTEAIELLAELEAGTERPDPDQINAAFKAGFDHAKTIILAEIAELL